MIDTVDKLRAISRFEMNDSNDKLLQQIFQDTLISFAKSNEIYMHRLQFLLYRHVINSEKLHFEKLFGRQLSAEMVFLQQKYEEYIVIIKQLAELLERSKVSYCILKGFSIISSLYSSNKKIYRDFGDLDILVDKKDVKEITTILNGMGFVQGVLDSTGEISEVDRKEIVYWRLTSHQEQTFIRKSKYSEFAPLICCRVDVNTSIFEGGKIPNPIPIRELLKHTRTHEISENVLIKSLDYEYELIQLCYHFYKDMKHTMEKEFFANYTLIKFCDIREYILKNRKNIDWEKFIRCVNKYQIGEQIYLPLLLVSDFYGDLEINNILQKINVNKRDVEIPDWKEVLM